MLSWYGNVSQHTFVLVSTLIMTVLASKGIQLFFLEGKETYLFFFDNVSFIQI